MDSKRVVHRTLMGENHTPFALARKLGARAILESAATAGGRSRYSILLLEEAFRIVQEEEGIFLLRQGERRELSSSDVLDEMEKIASGFESLEVPFPVGGVGYLSFEFAQFCDSVKIAKRTDPLELPLACFLFGHVFAVFDHHTDRIHLIGVNYGGGDDIPLETALDRVEKRINDLDFNHMVDQPGTYPAIVASSREERESYKMAVSRIRGEVVKGNLLQAVPSRRVEIATEMPSLEAYRILRSQNPSPYMFYLDFGNFQLFGASPEAQVTVRHGKAVVRPIAGTRRRGKTAAEDETLAKDLLGDEKERAEHLMLVDLARNDLGRVCVPGSVNVSEMMGVEKFSQVMHIVSRVEGTLASGKTAADAVRATFPAGTVSGAPKIQAINTISKLEKFPRSFYAGLVGYLEPDENFDSCIVIRSALKKENRLILQAGAGVVFDSNPERELEETDEKLRAMALAVGVEVRQ
ncbi:MAG: chorismate-binding protein [Spirochaetales bacterium]|nr:chorismate-binding protein [Spirochaetales bacterium]